jgi:hypothetical protein
MSQLVVFGSKPNIWAIDKLLPRLKTENLDHLFHESFRKGSEKFFSPCWFPLPFTILPYAIEYKKAYLGFDEICG